MAGGGSGMIAAGGGLEGDDDVTVLLAELLPVVTDAGDAALEDPLVGSNGGYAVVGNRLGS